MIKENKISFKIVAAARKLMIFDDSFVLILAAVLFVKVLYKTEDIIDSINIHWLLKAAIGGFLLGLAGMYCSEIHGVRYGVIEMILNNPDKYGVIILSILCMLKIVMTLVTIGVGGSGDVFCSFTVYGSSPWNLCSGNSLF